MLGFPSYLNTGSHKIYLSRKSEYFDVYTFLSMIFLGAQEPQDSKKSHTHGPTDSPDSQTQGRKQIGTVVRAVLMKVSVQ